MSVFRIYVEKKEEFAVEAAHILSDLKTALAIDSVESVRLLNRYDVEGLSKEVFDQATATIFSEPAWTSPIRNCPRWRETVCLRSNICRDSLTSVRIPAAQCISLMTQEKRPTVRNARCISLGGRSRTKNLQRLRIISSTRWKAVRHLWNR